MSNSLQPHGLYSPWNSPGQNPRVGSLSLLQAIVPTQGLNPGIPHCRRILYQLSHKRSPRTLEWVVFHFSSWSARPRNRTRVSCIAGRFFTSWATREAQEHWHGSSFPSPADLPDPGIEPGSPALQADSLPTELSVNLHSCDHCHNSILEHFHHPRRHLVPLYSHFLFPFPAPGTH